MAYHATFTPYNSVSAFRKAGLLSTTGKYFNRSRPIYANEPDGTMFPKNLITLPEKKREKIRDGKCLQPVIISHGYIYFTNGMVLFSDEDLMAIKMEQERAKETLLKIMENIA